VNLENTHWLQFSIRKNISPDIQIAYQDKHIVQTSSNNFLGLITDDTLSGGKKHIDYITAKLNSVCFYTGTVKSLLSKYALKIL
jgi:predicted NUDIX family phosphoesterase